MTKLYYILLLAREDHNRTMQYPVNWCTAISFIILLHWSFLPFNEFNIEIPSYISCKSEHGWMSKVLVSQLFTPYYPLHTAHVKSSLKINSSQFTMSHCCLSKQRIVATHSSVQQRDPRNNIISRRYTARTNYGIRMRPNSTTSRRNKSASVHSALCIIITSCRWR